jgi:hypothetical protein
MPEAQALLERPTAEVPTIRVTDIIERVEDSILDAFAASKSGSGHTEITKAFGQLESLSRMPLDDFDHRRAEMMTRTMMGVAQTAEYPLEALHHYERQLEPLHPFHIKH